MNFNIISGATSDDYAAFAALIRDYVAWARRRYGGESAFLEGVLAAQSFEAELAGLQHRYGPPNGRLLLARSGDGVRGCVAYRRLDEDACEMKRLFVPDRFRGQGIGRQLCETLFATARADGFTRMRLDTLDLMTEAIAVYRALGFQTCAPYQCYPDNLMPRIVFMEKRLGVVSQFENRRD